MAHVINNSWTVAPHEIEGQDIAMSTFRGCWNNMGRMRISNDGKRMYLIIYGSDKQIAQRVLEANNIITANKLPLRATLTENTMVMGMEQGHTLLVEFVEALEALPCY